MEARKTELFNLADTLEDEIDDATGKQKEELEARLEKVDAELARVKRKIERLR